MQALQQPPQRRAAGGVAAGPGEGPVRRKVHWRRITVTAEQMAAAMQETAARLEELRAERQMRALGLVLDGPEVGDAALEPSDDGDVQAGQGDARGADIAERGQALLDGLILGLDGIPPAREPRRSERLGGPASEVVHGQLMELPETTSAEDLEADRPCPREATLRYGHGDIITRKGDRNV